MFFNFILSSPTVMKVLLRNTIKLLKIVGYWPLETKNSRVLFVYQIHFYVILIAFCLTVLCVNLELPNAAKNGMKRFVNSVSVSAQFTYGLIKVLCFSLPVMKSLFGRVTLTEKNILGSKFESIKAIYMKYVDMNNKLDLYWALLVIVNAEIYTITSWVMKQNESNNDELLLPLDTYLPFDYRRHYKIAFVLNLIEGLVASVYIMAANMTYVGLMIFVTSQLAILRHEISEGINATVFNDEEIHQNLRQIVVRYYEVTKFVSDLDGVTKFLNLLYLIICVAHTSMIGFEVVTDDFSFQLFRNVWYLFVSLVADLLTWYWFGNEITVQHAALWDAVWESDWYYCNIKNKKTILILMMQLKKPLRLSVGFSHFMSLETMVMLLRNSISYTITLKQFYVMKEANN